jgi:MFS transporter, MHS family, alpha-ketoglutarate permease
VYTLLGTTASPWVALGIILIPITLHGGYTANNAMVKAELFPAHVRALGVAFPYAVGNTVLAGTVEYVALWFKSAGHESGFFWYVAAMVGMTVVAYLMLPETKTAGLIKEG